MINGINIFYNSTIGRRLKVVSTNKGQYKLKKERELVTKN